MTVALDVTLKWSKTADVDVRKRLQQPIAVAQAVATHVRRRVLQGRFASPPDAYSNKPTAGPKNARRYYVSPAYADKVGHKDETRYRSSADFHRTIGAKAGRGEASGEMWRSLQVRNYGAEGAVIDFQGSSLGSSSTRTAILTKKTGTYEVGLSDNGKLRAKQVKEYARDEGGAVKYRRKPRLVRNAHKAAAVYRHSRVGILQTTADELAAMGSALAVAAGQVVSESFGTGRAVAVSPQGDRALFTEISRRLKT